MQGLILSSINLTNETRRGTLLRMLLNQMGDDLQLQKATFEHYIPRDKYSQLYAKHWLHTSEENQLNQLPLHDLISVLTNREHVFDQSSILTSYDVKVGTCMLEVSS